MLQMLQLLSGAGGAKALHPEDVFSTYLYNGTGAALPIVNGIDQSGGDGSMTWIKKRNAIYDHTLLDTNRGANYLISNSTARQLSAGDAFTPTSSGFLLSSSSLTNAAEATYASWTFKQAPKFFFKALQAHTSGTPNTVDLSSLGTVGLVVVKSTLNAGTWYVFHRSLTTGKLLYLNTMAAETTDASISVSGTTLTLGSTLATNTYIVYAWAHDPSAEGIIQCGSFSGVGAVDLGFEPQYLLAKRIDVTDNWRIVDSFRGMSMPSRQELRANTTGIEVVKTNTSGSAELIPTATGFYNSSLGGNHIFLAIPRSRKPPTTGTEVYNASTANGVVSAGFPVDLHIGATRAGAANNHAVHSRLVGGTKELVTSSTAAEAAITDLGFDSMTGLRASLAVGGMNHFFKRAVGFMDVVCYTGTGIAHSEPHGLGVVPELVIIKARNSSGTNWSVLFDIGLSSYGRLLLNADGGTGTRYLYTNGFWLTEKPSDSALSLGVIGNNENHVNNNGTGYVAYLFATLTGISKVGSYTGNGSSQTIDCGFGTGVRFVLVKRIDAVGNWYVWDTARGIVAANDPHLSLNTTAAEVTTDDSVDPTGVGFIVSQNAATNINVTGSSYLFLAIA